MPTSAAVTPTPSSLTTLISSSKNPGSPLSATTTQVLHNLQHQHLWSSLHIHEFDTSANKLLLHRSNNNNTNSTPTLLISGIPPNRVYTHPDEQLFLLEKGLREGDIAPERVFVLPTVRGQSWSLGRMAGVFDVLPAESDDDTYTDTDTETETETGAEIETEHGSRSGFSGVVNNKEASGSSEKEKKLAEYYERKHKARRIGEWGGKKLLLAMVDKGMGGEGTVVYYVFQEGAVKPRQN